MLIGSAAKYLMSNVQDSIVTISKRNAKFSLFQMQLLGHFHIRNERSTTFVAFSCSVNNRSRSVNNASLILGGSNELQYIREEFLCTHDWKLQNPKESFKLAWSRKFCLNIKFGVWLIKYESLWTYTTWYDNCQCRKYIDFNFDTL